MTAYPCDSEILAGQCEGHLGKFASCEDEALYELTMMSYGDETTGSSEFQGHLTRVTLTETLPVTLSGTETVVSVPAGDYVVAGYESGAVSVYTYDATAWRSAELAYEAWDAPEWCDACSFDARCPDHAAMLAEHG